MQKRSRYSKGFFLLLAASFFIGCEQEPVDISRLIGRADAHTEEATEVEILYSDSAQLKVRTTGPVMLRHVERNEGQQEFPDGVKIEFFGPDQQLESILTAKYGLRQETQGLSVVRDSVVWISTKGERLETEELFWDEYKSRIYTKRFVTITRPEEIIYGYGFEANQDLSWSRILATTGRIKVKQLNVE